MYSHSIQHGRRHHKNHTQHKIFVGNTVFIKTATNPLKIHFRHVNMLYYQEPKKRQKVDSKSTKSPDVSLLRLWHCRGITRFFPRGWITCSVLTNGYIYSKIQLLLQPKQSLKKKKLLYLMRKKNLRWRCLSLSWNTCIVLRWAYYDVDFWTVKQFQVMERIKIHTKKYHWLFFLICL